MNGTYSMLTIVCSFTRLLVLTALGLDLFVLALAPRKGHGMGVYNV